MFENPYLSALISTTTLAAMLRISTPLIWASIGGSFTNKTGTFNIGIESFILTSAFFAMCGSYLAHSPWLGLLFGVLSGLLLAGLFGLFVLHFRANSMVVGISLNLSAWGLTTLLMVVLFNTRGSIHDPSIVPFSPIDVPVLRDIPILSDIFNNQTILVYSAIVVALLAWLVMYKTPFGLRLRSVGLNERAAQTAGVNVNLYRWISILISGALAGVGGTFLSLNNLAMFNENMSAGRGFLAVAAIMMGNGNPLKVLLACFVFGYAEALTTTMQGLDIPSQIIRTFPYIATLVVMFLSCLKNFKGKPLLDIRGN